MASSPRVYDQPSLSDMVCRMSWTIHFKAAANLEVRDGGLDFNYATGDLAVTRPALGCRTTTRRSPPRTAASNTAR